MRAPPHRFVQVIGVAAGRPSAVARASCAGAISMLLLAGCGGATGGPPDDASAQASDLAPSTPDAGAGGAVFAQVSFAGCPSVGMDGGTPHCSGPVPLEITLVPIVPPDVMSFLWTIPGGLPDRSQMQSPTVAWSLPGSYRVQLAVASAGGQASAEAEVDVIAGDTGAPCRDDRQCGNGLGCTCGDAGDGGACPGELTGGLCTRACTGDGCAADTEACVDLSRSAGDDPGAESQPFRHALCLPLCASSAECRPGFACRELPALLPGAIAGGAFGWRKACFASVLGDVGHPCADAFGKPDPTSCIGGGCAPLGARGMCTSPCDASPCPSTAVCATFTYDPEHPICIPRCDAGHPCGDPLLDCQSANADGKYGFSVPQAEPQGGTYCAPKRCAVPADCGPAGRCAPLGGAPSFCVP